MCVYIYIYVHKENIYWQTATVSLLLVSGATNVATTKHMQEQICKASKLGYVAHFKIPKIIHMLIILYRNRRIDLLAMLKLWIICQLFVESLCLPS